MPDPPSLTQITWLMIAGGESVESLATDWIEAKREAGIITDYQRQYPDRHRAQVMGIMKKHLGALDRAIDSAADRWLGGRGLLPVDHGAPLPPRSDQPAPLARYW